ncbi:hypothetical protein C8R43DRAFT_910409, partial [Mycena crocata]
ANFRVDVMGTNRSQWNKSAARVFSEITIRRWHLPNTFQLFHAIYDAFSTHLETIIRRYKHSIMSKPDRLLRESADRRQTRKYQVFILSPSLGMRRRYIAYTFKPLQKHIKMLEELGVDGMSSDESQKEDNARTPEYHILAPSWRARRVAPWLRMFDSLHHILRKEGEAAVSRGGWPRYRKITQKKSSSSKFVAGLPRNFYDSRWIESDALRKYDLRADAVPYDFTHDDDIMKFVFSLEQKKNRTEPHLLASQLLIFAPPMFRCM